MFCVLLSLLVLLLEINDEIILKWLLVIKFLLKKLKMVIVILLRDIFMMLKVKFILIFLFVGILQMQNFEDVIMKDEIEFFYCYVVLCYVFLVMI